MKKKIKMSEYPIYSCRKKEGMECFVCGELIEHGENYHSGGHRICHIGKCAKEADNE